jgi:hypothetical protein
MLPRLSGEWIGDGRTGTGTSIACTADWINNRDSSSHIHSKVTGTSRRDICRSGKGENSGMDRPFHPKKVQILDGLAVICLLVGGFVVDHWAFHQRCTLLVPMSFLALFTLLIPSTTNIVELVLVVAGQGICSGWIDNASQILCIRYKNEDKVEVGPYLQALHFAFAFGAVLAPFIFAVRNTHKALANCSCLISHLIVLIRPCVLLVLVFQPLMGTNALISVSSVEAGGDSTQNQYNQQNATAIANQETSDLSIYSPSAYKV